MVLPTAVEVDDNKIQRSVNYFSTFFIKNKQKSLLQVTAADIIFQWLNWNTSTQTVPFFYISFIKCLQLKACHYDNSYENKSQSSTFRWTLYMTLECSKT